MKTEIILTEGYGHIFGFSRDRIHWASATAGLIHIWKNFELVFSHEIPGFEKGNIAFRNDEWVHAGLFEINIKTREKIYRDSLPLKFSWHGEEGKTAHYSQYRIEEIKNFPKENQLLISIAHQPARGLNKETRFNGPTHRLLLFRRSDAELLSVVAENHDFMTYENLFLSEGEIIFTHDNSECFAVAENSNLNKDSTIAQFSPLYLHQAKKFLAGSFNSRYIQFREFSSLAVSGQLAGSFRSIEHIDGHENFIFTAVNNNELQAWKIGNLSKEADDQISFDGSIEGLGINTDGLCFTALAGKESRIHVVSHRVENNKPTSG